MIAVKTTPWENILAVLSNDHSLNWTPSEGPDSKVGIDIYYQNEALQQEAWINKDQEHVLIQIAGETVWEGEEDDLESILPPHYIRVSVKVEDLQDSSKILSHILNPAEAIAAEHIFDKFDMENDQDSLQEPVLYTVEVASDKGGTYQDFRTAEELVALLLEFKIEQEEALALLQEWTKTAVSPQKIRGTEIHLTATRLDHPLSEKKFQEVVTDPDEVGTSSYRTAADLAATACSLEADANDVDPNLTLSQDNLTAIEIEMAELLSASLQISGKCRPFNTLP